MASNFCNFKLSNSTAYQQHAEQLRQQAAPTDGAPPRPNQSIIGIVQPMNAVGAAVQTNRMTRGGSSLKRSSGDAFSGGRSSNGNLMVTTIPTDLQLRDSVTTTNNNETFFNTHITSPPPLMFSPNSTSIRLATGSQTPQNVDIIGGLF